MCSLNTNTYIRTHNTDGKGGHPNIHHLCPLTTQTHKHTYTHTLTHTYTNIYSVQHHRRNILPASRRHNLQPSLTHPKRLSGKCIYETRHVPVFKHENLIRCDTLVCNKYMRCRNLRAAVYVMNLLFNFPN